LSTSIVGDTSVLSGVVEEERADGDLGSNVEESSDETGDRSVLLSESFGIG